MEELHGQSSQTSQVQQVQLTQQIMRSSLGVENIETFVSQPSWRELLLELVHSNQMDPWDIDLVVIADKYLQTVRQLAAVDLRLPANIILATALLLRFKANGLSLEETTTEDELAFGEEAPRELIAEEIPRLIVRQNKARPRKITLEELLRAVEEVVNSNAQTQLLLSVPKILELELPKEDLHELIKKIYVLAHELKDENDVLVFSSLLDPTLLNRDKRSHVVSRLIPVLHLVNEGKVEAWQEQTFGEIKIKML